jgi:hypothetical protein
MAYQAGDLIEAVHYNTFSQGGASPNDNVANLDTIWGAGTGDKGWGQSSPVGAVNVAATVTATQWTTLLNRMNTVSNQTGQSITAITNPTAGNTISAFTALGTNITNLFNARNNAAAVGSAITANGVATRSTSWNSALTATHTITFANAASMRYFFNAGGRVTWAGARSGGSATTQNTTWTNLLTACGTLNWTTGTSTQTIAGTSYTGTTKIGGSGSATILTGVGFYDFTTGNQEVFKQFSSTYLYTANFVSINILTNAAPGSSTTMTLTVSFTDAQTRPTDSVDGTLTSTVTLVQPSTANGLSNTWGTPTISSSITGS